MSEGGREEGKRNTSHISLVSSLFATGVSSVDHLGRVTLDQSDVSVSLHLTKSGSGKRTTDLHALDKSGRGDQLHLG